MNASAISEGKKDRPYRANERLVTAARKVSPPDRSREQGVTNEELDGGFAGSRHPQADASRTVARSVMRQGLAPAERDDFPRRVELVDWRQLVDGNAEHEPLLNRAVVQE